jgi:hypothetical protein
MSRRIGVHPPDGLRPSGSPHEQRRESDEFEAQAAAGDLPVAPGTDALGVGAVRKSIASPMRIGTNVMVRMFKCPIVAVANAIV